MDPAQAGHAFLNVSNIGPGRGPFFEDQGNGTGGCTRLSLTHLSYQTRTRVVVYRTDETTLRGVLGAAWLFIALKINAAKLI